MMKYAVLETGGKQYIAREGEMIEIDRLPLEIGKPVEFNEVLLIVDGNSIQVGDPLVKGATVKGEVLDQIKAKKVIVFKYIPKERYRRKQGHRQRYTQVRIDEIVAGGPKKAAAVKTAQAPVAEAPVAEPAAKKAEDKSTPAKAKKAEAKPAAAKAKKAETKPKTASKPASKSDSAAKSKSSSKAAPKTKSSSGSKSTARKSSSSTKKPSTKKTSTKKDK